MIYDIFISYRRNGGYETAKHIFDLLRNDGYNVSFDIDTLRNGDFDTELLKRIDECTDFILILNQGAFDRTLDPSFNPQKDWMRNELAYALKQNKNIIPILLNGFTEFPGNLPDDISKVERKNGPKYDSYYFDDFYNRLKTKFLETKPSIAQQSGQQSGESVTLHIKPDVNCRVLLFGKELGLAESNRFTPFRINRGNCFFELVDAENNKIRYTTTYTSDKSVEEDYLIVNLSPLKNELIEKNKEIAVRKYDSIGNFSEGRAKICFNLKYGFIDTNYNEIISPRYEYVSDYCNGFAVGSTYRNSKMAYTLLDSDGKEMFSPLYENMKSVSEGLVAVKKEGKWGYIDTKGNLIIPAIYAEAYLFNEGLAVVKEYGAKESWFESDPLIDDDFKSSFFRTTGKWGAIDHAGNIVIPFQYEELFSFTEGFARFMVDVQYDFDEITGGKYGFIDRLGKEVIPPMYEKASRFQDGMAEVYLHNAYSYIDTEGNQISYDSVKPIPSKHAIVCKNGKYGITDLTGKRVVSLKYEKIESISENRAIIFSHAKYGLVDFNDRIIIPAEYESIKKIGNHFLKVMDSDGKWGIVNDEGLELVSPVLDEIGKWSGDYIIVKREGKWGYMEINGLFIIAPRYDEAYQFQENRLAIVKSNGKYGCINMKGEEIIPLRYDDINGFSNGLADIMQNGKWGYIDSEGNEVVPCKYDEATSFLDDTARIKRGNLYGRIDLSGKEVVPCLYEKIERFNRYGLCRASINNKWGLIDRQGTEQLPIAYDQISEFDRNNCAEASLNGKKYRIHFLENRITIEPLSDKM